MLTYDRNSSVFTIKTVKVKGYSLVCHLIFFVSRIFLVHDFFYNSIDAYRFLANGSLDKHAFRTG